MTTITTPTASFVPLTVDGYESSRDARTIVHSILGATAPSVVLRKAGMRSGTLTCVFSSLALAQSFEAAVTAAVVLTLADTDVPGVGMSFVISGPIQTSLDNDTRQAGVTTLDFTEVPTPASVGYGGGPYGGQEYGA